MNISKKSLGTILGIIVTVIALFGGENWLRETQFESRAQEYIDKIDTLQNQVTELQDENKTLTAEKKTEGTNEGDTESTDESTPKELAMYGTRCDATECLVKNMTENTLVGLATLKGHYTQVEKSAWGETEQCDSLVVTSGSQALIDEFTQWVKDGNSLNSLDADGTLVINLDLSTLATADRDKIIASTSENEVDLLVVRPMVEGFGAPACYSLVNIIDVK